MVCDESECLWSGLVSVSNAHIVSFGVSATPSLKSVRKRIMRVVLVIHKTFELG